MAHTSCWYLSAQEFLDVALIFPLVAVKNDKFNLQFIVYVGPETDERYQVYVGSDTDERYLVYVASEISWKISRLYRVKNRWKI